MGYTPRFSMEGENLDKRYVRYFVKHALGGGTHSWYVVDGGSMGQEPFYPWYTTPREAWEKAKELDHEEHNLGHPRSKGVIDCCDWCKEEKGTTERDDGGLSPETQEMGIP